MILVSGSLLGKDPFRQTECVKGSTFFTQIGEIQNQQTERWDRVPLNDWQHCGWGNTRRLRLRKQISKKK